MKIISDDRECWQARLPGWPTFPVKDIQEKQDSLDSRLWSQLAQDCPASFQIGQTHDTSLEFWDHLYLVQKSAISQYDILRKYFSQHPDDSRRVACLAASGENFHGQHNRHWQALTGNFHLSISVPMDIPVGAQSLGWTMLPSVALMQMMEKLLGDKISRDMNCGIKWVNDVFWEGQKLAGVISAVVSEKGRIRRGYLGIGLNVAVAPNLSGGNDSTQTTCLHQKMSASQVQLGKILDLVLTSLSCLIPEFEQSCGGHNGEAYSASEESLILKEYRRNSLVVGRRVRILADPLKGPGSEICQGKVLKINPDLSLVVEGHEVPISEGRLFFQE